MGFSVAMFDDLRVSKCQQQAKSSITYEDALRGQLSQLAQDLKIEKLPTGIGAGFEVKDPKGFTCNQGNPANGGLYASISCVPIWLPSGKPTKN